MFPPVWSISLRSHLYLGRRLRQLWEGPWIFGTLFSPSSTLSSTMLTPPQPQLPGLSLWSTFSFLPTLFTSSSPSLYPVSLNLSPFALCSAYRFPSDPNCKSIDQQFLWGGSLLISPVLSQGAVKVKAYLPLGTWYSLYNVSAHVFGQKDDCYWIKWKFLSQLSLFCPFKGQAFHSKGQFFLLPAPLDTINIHVRQGHIIPQQVGLWSKRKAVC